MVVYGINQTELALGNSWIADTKRDAVIAGIKDIGAQYVRIGAVWQSIQPGAGLTSLNWAPMDACLNKVQAAGLIPLLILQFPNPYWSNNPSDFGAFCKLVATRYGPQGTNQVHHWEVMNEQNSAANLYPPTALTYLPHLKNAYTAIKSVAPGAQSLVISGGVMSCPTDIYTHLTVDTYQFVADMINGGGGDYFDALGYHWYSNASGQHGAAYGAWQEPTTTQDYYVELTQCRDLMVSKGLSAKQIWVTEFGLPAPTLSTDTIGTWLPEQLNNLLALSYLGPPFIYDYMNTGSNDSDINNQWGLVKYDLTPKQPAYNIIRALNGQRAAAFGVNVGLSVKAVPAVKANFGVGVGLSSSTMKVALRDANFSVGVALSSDRVGYPDAKFGVGTALNMQATESHTVAASFSPGVGLASASTKAAQGGFSLPVNVGLQVVVSQQKTFSDTFTTKPSTFTEWNLGYQVLNSKATAYGHATDGNYYDGAYHTQRCVGANHFAEYYTPSGYASFTGFDRSNIAIVRYDPATGDMVFSVSYVGTGWGHNQIYTRIGGVYTQRSTDAYGSGIGDLERSRLVADGNTYSVQKNGVDQGCVWVDNTGIYPHPDSPYAGFGFYTARSSNMDYTTGGISRFDCGDIRPVIMPPNVVAPFAVNVGPTFSAAESHTTTAAFALGVALAATTLSNTPALFATSVGLSAAVKESHTAAAGFATGVAYASGAKESHSAAAGFTVGASMSATPKESHNASASFTVASSVASTAGESHTAAAAFSVGVTPAVGESEQFTVAAPFATSVGLFVGVGSQAAATSSFAVASTLSFTQSVSFAANANLALAVGLSATAKQSQQVSEPLTVSVGLSATAKQSQQVNAALAAAVTLSVSALQSYSYAPTFGVGVGYGATAVESHGAPAAFTVGATFSVSAVSSYTVTTPTIPVGVALAAGAVQRFSGTAPFAVDIGLAVSATVYVPKYFWLSTPPTFPGIGASYQSLTASPNVAWTTTEGLASTPLSDACTVTGITMWVSNAPVGASTWTLTLRKNGTNTAAAVTVTGSATTATWTGSVSLAQLDIVNIMCSGTGSPAAPGSVYYTITYTCTAGQLLPAQNTGVLSSSTGTYYEPIVGSTAVTPTTTSDFEVVVPTGLTAVRVAALNLANGAATNVGGTNTYTIVNQTTAATSAFSAVLSGAVTTGISGSGAGLAFSAGDRLALKEVRSGSSWGTVNTCMTVQPSTSGEQVQMFANGIAPSTTAANYALPQGTGSLAWNAVANEYLVSFHCPACTLKKLYVRLATAPGTSKSRQFNVRSNLAASGVTATVSGAAVTASDAINVATHGDGNFLGIETVPSGTPAATSGVKLGFVLVPT